MSLRETVAPIDALDELTQWGHPWHGLVTGGQLALPNGTSMTYPQPATGDWPYLQGATSLIDFGAPDVTISQEDAAQGMEWRSVATLSGAESQIYGKALGAGRWIYKAPSGDRWLINAGTINGRSAEAASLGVSLSVQRFGEFPAEGRSAVYAVPVQLPADWGQSEPEIKDSGGTPIGIGSLILRLQMVRPDGGAAIFALDYSSFAEELPPRAFGFAELVLSGDGAGMSAVLNIIRTRSQTAGEGINQPFEVTYRRINGAVIRTVDGSFDPPCTPRQVVLEEEMVAFLSSSYPYTGPSSPGIEAAYQELLSIMPPPAENLRSPGWYDGSAYNFSQGFLEHSGAARFANLGTVIALFYRADGSIGEITFDEDLSVSHVPRPIAINSQSPFRRVFTLTGNGTSSCETTSVVESQMQWTVTWGGSATAVKSLALKVDGAVVWSDTKTQSFSSDYTVQGSGVSAADQSPSGVFSASYSPGGYSGSSEFSDMDVNYGAGAAPTYEFGTAVPNLRLLGGRDLWREVENVYIVIRSEPHRYAPAVVGIVQHRDNLRTPLSPVATPSGARAAVMPAAFEDGAVDLMGSHCPVTGEVAIDTVPVCWV